MGLRLYRRAPAFAAALAASSGAVYSICNRDRFDPAQALSLERGAAAKKHRELLGLDELRTDALAAINTYFRNAARLDPTWQYAYSSKVVLAVPDYQDLQKVFLLGCLLARDPQREIFLLVPDPRLHRLFGELFAAVPPVPRLVLPGPRAWARFLRTLLRAMANRPAAAPAGALIFTLSAGNPASDNDAYFGEFARQLRNLAPTVTVYLASGPALKLCRSPHRLPFESFASSLTVIAAWIDAFFSGVRAHGTADRFGADKFASLHRYMRSTEVRCGEYFMHRLYGRVFPRMLREVAPRLLLYPFENRSWEKLLLAAAHAQGVGRRIGYQHSSITPRHLAFHVAPGEIPDKFLPDRIFTVGDFTAEWLRQVAPVLAGKLAIGVSLRTARQKVSAPGGAVLVAISSSRNEAWNLLQVTHAAASQSDVPFIVRTHPTIPVKDLFGLFGWPQNVELSAGRTLAEDLSRATIIAYSSSTVALEGMLYGRIPIFVDTGDIPSGDPIPDAHPFKFTARDGADLAHRISQISELGAAAASSLREQARAYAERYLRDPTADAVHGVAAAMLTT